MKARGGIRPGMKVCHDSHDLYFRHPFGAVPCGTEIRLRLTVEGAPVPVQCRLLLWEEQEGREVSVPMELVEEEKQGDGRLVFAAGYRAPATPGLVWYYFCLDTGEGRWYYGNNGERLGGKGALSRQEPPAYQITVFKPWQVPAWWKRAVVYQIFVDRFCRDEEYFLAEGIRRLARQGGLWHADWYDTPFYIKDAAGRVTRWTFFGGNLAGVRNQLDYLQELGVTCLYFNPIFEASSNHKYDTGDYLKIDPLYGNEAVFEELVREAEKRGIQVILDGVFSHTGADSLYFNKYGRYPGLGAYQSPASPYYRWYRFKQYPEEYECWWGIEVLPNVDEMEHSYREFIFGGENSVVRHWMKKGVKGWRLDVADELPDPFIKELRHAVRSLDPEAVLIGEVWEDASHKISYGQRRAYLWGEELDGVTNYPLRETWLAFLLGRIDAAGCHRRVMSLYENYPRESFYAALNLIGSHDRVRVLTLLGEAPPEEELAEAERERYRLPPEQRELARRRLKLLALMQFTFPGVPCVYYGDEAGMEGYSDPYNRGPYPWGREDRELVDWYRRLGKLRKEYEVLVEGDFRSFYQGEDVYGFRRTGAEEEILVLINRHPKEAYRVALPRPAWDSALVLELLTGTVLAQANPPLEVDLPPLEARVIYYRRRRQGAQRAPRLPRAAGVLLPVTALPSPWGLGDLGENAYRFVDFLAAAGQRVWQVLPLNPVGEGNSPYYSPGSFAGNPWLISPEGLVEEGLLLPEELERARAEAEGQRPLGRVHYALAAAVKEKLFRRAFARWQQGGAGAGLRNRYEDFCQKEAYWLPDYCLYAALKERQGGAPWYRWEEGLARRQPAALAGARRELAAEVAYQEFLQFLLHEQWQKLKAYANQKGIILFGDLPIYVAPDSCDTWSHREYFVLDDNGRPAKVAGVPPDDFSPEGQLWGHPLYNWERLAQDGFAWWVERLRRARELFDYVRLDHFRGFEAYWELPAGAASAAAGRWRKGPGKKFFAALEKALGPLPLVAEDLGFITPEVKNLKHIWQLPGMKVYQFSRAEMLEAREEQVVYYTGTHDNDTLWAWGRENNFPGFRETCKGEDITPQKYCASVIAQLYFTPAAWVIVPMQDILGLGSEARMNVPGKASGNWEWQLAWELVTEEVARRLRQLAEKSLRLGAPGASR